MQEAAKAIAAPTEAMQKIVLVVEGRAKVNSPVGETGNLQRSNRGIVDSPTVGELANSAEYAPFVEFGTEYMTARPFGEDAIEESHDDIMSILTDYGVKVLGTVGGGGGDE